MTQRTLKQNKSLHKFFTILAQDLNDAGLDQRKVLKPGIEIPWTSATIKAQLWKPIQDVMLEKESTTELTTKEVNQVYEVLIRHLGEKFGITTAFPSEQEISNSDLGSR